MFSMNWDRFERFVEFPLAEPMTASGNTTTTLGSSTIKNEVRGSQAAQENTATFNIGEGLSTSINGPQTDGAYDIQPIPCKGKGMIATAKIPKGARILLELLLFRVPRENPDDISAVDDMVISEVSRLNVAQRCEFLDLANIHGAAHSLAMGIARTNVLPLGSNSCSGGLSLVALRINHSC